MRLFWKLDFLVLLCASLTVTKAIQNCDPIGVCDNFHVERVLADIPNWQNETEIGQSGHWNNIIPQLYNMNLKFHNRSYYTGSVEITVKLTNSTNRIMINCGNKNPSIDYSSIFIKPDCHGKEGAYAGSNRPKMVSTRCIERVIEIEKEDTIELRLKGIQLTPKEYYTITLPSFTGKTGPDGASGLIESIQDNSFSLTTLFQMRDARSVFPCFDHPALKAQFQFCIDHPVEMMVASNMPIQGKCSMNTLQSTCFEQTPPLPTYLFTFALMENFASQSIQVPNGPLIEVYARQSQIDNVLWMLEDSIPAIHYMENITNLKFPLKKFGFVVAYGYPVWGFENFGLIAVQEERMVEQSLESYTILYHEIVHQWLGDIVTVSVWREICLQEGLTAYFEWKISADQLGESLENRVYTERRYHDYDPFALVEYKELNNITNKCYRIPALFFHMITKHFGFEVIERMLAKLIEWRPYGTADIHMWDKALNQAVPEEEKEAMKGFMEGWFQQRGMLYMTITKEPTSDCCITIHQRYMHSGEEIQPDSSRPIPLTLNSFSPLLPSFIEDTPLVLHTLHQTVCNLFDVILVDPNDDTVTRKVYSAELYHQILQFHQENPSVISDHHFQNLVNGFCHILINDVLPLKDDPANPIQWLNVIQLMRNFTHNLPHKCHCCLDEVGRNGSCFMNCENLRLTHFIHGTTRDTFYSPKKTDDIWKLFSKI